MHKTLVDLTVVGPDREGIVSAITSFIFKNGGNIEAINQNVVKGIFGMQLEASFESLPSEEYLERGLESLAKELNLEIGSRLRGSGTLKRMAVLVSKEIHCLKAILREQASGRLRVEIPVMIGSSTECMKIAEKASIPFHLVNDQEEGKREMRMLKLLEECRIDFIALARYMKILSPNFIWRYPNRIINIHPSLLPAFPGASAYVQAYERGARVIGCTAHFATWELDEGPIIWQEAFHVKPGESLETIVKRGKRVEANVLVRALKLYAKDKLQIEWKIVRINR
ncbi:MAG: formyltetrahydrofolate deformylase [Thaumarchaeota archaeon]|nr:formyltetrahydrofolate deformylase [Nitrososphaerota archaeon]